MKAIEGYIFIILGVFILFVVPVFTSVNQNRMISDEMKARVSDDFLEIVYSTGEITKESYLMAYERMLLISENTEFRVRLLHLEGIKNDILSDYFYVTDDEEIRKELMNSAINVRKGVMVEVYE